MKHILGLQIQRSLGYFVWNFYANKPHID